MGSKTEEKISKVGRLSDLPTKRICIEESRGACGERRFRPRRSVPTVSARWSEHTEPSDAFSDTARAAATKLAGRTTFYRSGATSPITDLQPRPAEICGCIRWNCLLKSKGLIRGLLRIVWDYAMWSGVCRLQAQPDSAGDRQRLYPNVPGNLAAYGGRVSEVLVQALDEPFRTIALVCVCFGLRISECLALKWS